MESGVNSNPSGSTLRKTQAIGKSLVVLRRFTRNAPKLPVIRQRDTNATVKHVALTRPKQRASTLPPLTAKRQPSRVHHIANGSRDESASATGRSFHCSTRPFQVPRLALGNVNGGAHRISRKSIAVMRWQRAERCLVASSMFPKLLAIQNQKRMEELKRVEREERAQFDKTLKSLPHIRARLTEAEVERNFWRFFQKLERLTGQQRDVEEGERGKKSMQIGTAVLETDFSEKNLDEFIRFCKVHKSYETKRRLFYSMCARQIIKSRQLELLKTDRDSYERRATFVRQLLEALGKEMEDSTRENTSDDIINECLSELLAKYAARNFQLCSLKCREHFLSMRQCRSDNQAVVYRRQADSDRRLRMAYLLWERDRHRGFIDTLHVNLTKALQHQ